MGFREFGRSDRVALQLRRETAELLRQEVHDERLRQLVVTDVQVTRDLQRATVFYVLPEKVDAGDVATALKKAAGFLRGSIAKRMRLRKVPELIFRYDHKEEEAERLWALVDQADTGSPVEPDDLAAPAVDD